MAGKIKKGGKPIKPMSPEEFVAKYRERQAAPARARSDNRKKRGLNQY